MHAILPLQTSSGFHSFLYILGYKNLTFHHSEHQVCMNLVNITVSLIDLKGVLRRFSIALPQS